MWLMQHLLYHRLKLMWWLLLRLRGWAHDLLLRSQRVLGRQVVERTRAHLCCHHRVHGLWQQEAGGRAHHVALMWTRARPTHGRQRRSSHLLLLV
jgi:hypothetical protein